MVTDWSHHTKIVCSAAMLQNKMYAYAFVQLTVPVLILEVSDGIINCG